MAQISDFKLELEEDLDENIREAFEMSPGRVGTGIEQHEILRQLSYDVIAGDADNEDEEDSSVDEVVFRSETAFLLMDWDAIHTREQALLLGLKADYSSANSLLRGCLDGMMKGVFLNALMSENLHQKIDLRAEDFHSDDVDLDEFLNTVESTDYEHTAVIMDIIQQTNNEGILEIRPGRLRGILAELGHFKPYDGNEVGDFYHHLGSAVHKNPQFSLTDQAMEAEGHPFAPPQHVRDLLNDFLNKFEQTLDLLGVLTVMELKEHIKNRDRIQRIYDSRTYGLRQNGLSKTYKALADISDYSE